MKNHWTLIIIVLAMFALLIYIPLSIQKVSSQNTTGETKSIPGIPTQPKNVRVLTGFTLQELHLKMVDIAKALGKKCVFCHNVNDFSSDDKEQKSTARKMLKMVKDLNENYFNYPNAPKISCYTCHRGNQKPIHKPEDEKK